MVFEIQIPAAQTGQYDSTLQVDAKSWRQAYLVAVERAGMKPESLADHFVHIEAGVIRVTSPTSRSVVRMRRLENADAGTSQVVRALTGANQPVMRQSSSPHAPVGFTDKSTGAFRAIGAAEIEQVKTDQASQSGRILGEFNSPSGTFDAQMRSDPGVADTADVPPAQSESVGESALEDVFLDIMTIFEPGYAMEDAIDFVIDLGMRYVPSEHGLVLFASDKADFLYAAAARGPLAQPILDAKFPIDRGIPAESLRHGIALSLTNPQTDTRYSPDYAGVGIQEQSIVAAPIQSGERAFGVFVLFNRKGRAFYSQYDANIVSYIGAQMGKFIQQMVDATPLE